MPRIPAIITVLLAPSAARARLLRSLALTPEFEQHQPEATTTDSPPFQPSRFSPVSTDAKMADAKSMSSILLDLAGGEGKAGPMPVKADAKEPCRPHAGEGGPHAGPMPAKALDRKKARRRGQLPHDLTAAELADKAGTAPTPAPAGASPPRTTEGAPTSWPFMAQGMRAETAALAATSPLARAPNAYMYSSSPYAYMYTSSLQQGPHAYMQLPGPHAYMQRPQVAEGKSAEPPTPSTAASRSPAELLAAQNIVDFGASRGSNRRPEAVFPPTRPTRCLEQDICDRHFMRDCHFAIDAHRAEAPDGAEEDAWAAELTQPECTCGACDSVRRDRLWAKATNPDYWARPKHVTAETWQNREVVANVRVECTAPSGQVRAFLVEPAAPAAGQGEAKKQRRAETPPQEGAGRAQQSAPGVPSATGSTANV